MNKMMKSWLKYVIAGAVILGVVGMTLYLGDGALYKGAFSVAPASNLVKVSPSTFSLPNVELLPQTTGSSAPLGTTVVCNSFKVKNNTDGMVYMRKMVFQLTSVDAKTELFDMMMSLQKFTWVDGLPNYHLDFSANASNSFYIVFDLDADLNDSSIWSTVVSPKSTFTESLTMIVQNVDQLIGKKFRCDFKPELSKILTAKDAPATLNSRADIPGSVLTVTEAPIR